MRNLQEQVKKAFCYQKKLFWPFTVWINCSSDLKKFANSWPSPLNFKSFSWSIKQFFLTVGRNNFCNKILFLFFQAKQLMPGCHLPLLYIGVEYGLTNNVKLAEKFFTEALGTSINNDTISQEKRVKSW